MSSPASTTIRGRRRARLAALVLGGLLATLVSSQATPAAASTQSTLRDRVNSALRGSTADVVAVHVVVEGLGTVVSRRSSTSVRPASTQKMYVGLTALLMIGPRARLTTSVRATAAPDETGTVHGHLILRGTGDPTLNTADLAELATALRAQGVRTVTGALYGDDRYFDRARRAPGWRRSWVPVESGPLSSVVVNRNRWRKDASYLEEPVRPNVGRFRPALKAAGIRVVGGTRLGHPAARSIVLTKHRSPRLATIVRRMLKESDNMTAELLLKQLGARYGAGGTTAAGAAVVRARLKSLGVGVGTMADGSGLSRYNRQTVAGEVALLRAAARTSLGGTFRTSLAKACRDGTLEDRMCGTAASGRVYAKTGTLDSVRALSGYTWTRSGRRVWFSIVLSGCRPGLSCRNAIDRAVVQLAAFAR